MASSFDWCFVGIGNPEGQHARDRHNAGKIALRAAARVWACAPPREGSIAPCAVGGSVAALYLTPSFMNASGAELRRVLGASGVPLRRLVVWHDDVDLALGTIRLSWAARSGGHRGVSSIERSVGSRSWWRLRFGISPQGPDQRLRKPDKAILADWLVAEADPAELKCYEAMGEFVGGVLAEILQQGDTLHPTTWNLSGCTFPS